MTINKPACVGTEPVARVGSFWGGAVGPRLPANMRTFLSDAWRPWLAVHLIVVAAYLFVLIFYDGALPRSGDAPIASGLFGWDAGWYRSIAQVGYSETGTTAIRFFPLLPLLGAALSPLGIGISLGLVLVTSTACLLYLIAIVGLTSTLTGDPAIARRAAWVAGLVPGGAVLALPYTEGLAGLAVVGFFLALLRGSGRSGFAAGVVSGLVRPTGVLLVIPALVVAISHPERRRVALLSAAGPLVGTSAFLLWAGARTGDCLAPYRSQGGDDLRGGLLVNPVPGVLADTRGGIGPPATFALMAVCAVLVVLALRSLPLALGLWSAATLVLSIASIGAHSLPRYTASIVPLLLVLALRLQPGWRWQVFRVVSPAMSVLLTAAWLAGKVVP